MSQKLKLEAEVKTVDGETIPLLVVRPSAAVKAEADIVRSRAWGQYAVAGVPLQSKVKDIIARQGLWDDEKRKRLEEIDARMAANEAKLPDKNGKVRAKGLKLSEARDAAFQLRKDRAERVALLTEITRLNSETAEGKADNEAFDFLVSKCVLDARTQKPVFPTLDDYRARGDTPEGQAAAVKFAELYYDHDADFDKKLPENVFLAARGFVDPETLEEKRPEPPKAEEPAAEFDLEDDLAPPPAAAEPAPPAV